MAEQGKAMCLGVVDVFFGQLGERRKDRIPREAKAVALCRQCPMLAGCLADEDAMPTYDGVRAGLTPEQRAERRQQAPALQRKPIDHGTSAGAHADRRRGEKPCAACGVAAARAAAEWKIQTGYKHPRGSNGQPVREVG